MQLIQSLKYGYQQNVLNYLCNKAHGFNFRNLAATLKDKPEKAEVEIKKQIRKIFDKSDCRSDEERSGDMHFYNN